MKKGVLLATVALTCLTLMATAALASKWWILGTVTGNRSRDAVVTLRLVRQGNPDYQYVVETSTNKYGQYAFSNPGQNLPPSAYKLVVYVGDDRVTEVGLDGVRPGGRVPPIAIHW